MEKRKQGFATMSREQQMTISSKGGRTISQNKEHMSKIGKIGAQKSVERRRELAELKNKTES